MLIHMVYPTSPKDEMLNVTRQDVTSPDLDFTLFLHKESRSLFRSWHRWKMPFAFLEPIANPISP